MDSKEFYAKNQTLYLVLGSICVIVGFAFNYASIAPAVLMLWMYFRVKNNPILKFEEETITFHGPGFLNSKKVFHNDRITKMEIDNNIVIIEDEVKKAKIYLSKMFSKEDVQEILKLLA